MQTVDVRRADLNNAADQAAILTMLDAYSSDPMGDGKPLDSAVRARLIEGLRTFPTTRVLLAWLDGNPVGVAVCFIGFSTFRAQPLINIHDLAVLPGYRGAGIGKQLLAAVEAMARELGCCKITLEVLENNHMARAAYAKAGFAPVTYDPAAGSALFLARPLWSVT